MDSPLRLTIETDLSRIDARQWDALAGDQPFLRHAFLCALHDTCLLYTSDAADE